MSADSLAFFDLDGYSTAPSAVSTYATSLVNTFSSPAAGTSTYMPFPDSPNTSDSDPLAAFFDMSALPMFDDLSEQRQAEQLYEQLLGGIPTDRSGMNNGTNGNGYGLPDATMLINAQPVVSPHASPVAEGFISPAFSPAPSEFYTSPDVDSPLPSFESFDMDFQPMFDVDGFMTGGTTTQMGVKKEQDGNEMGGTLAAPPTLDLKKLDKIKAGAQQEHVRALFPELLPTIERLRKAVLQKPSPSTTQTQPTNSTTPTYTPQQQQEDRPKSRVGRKRKPRPTDPLQIAAELSAKRQKNTEAARRSRMRKMLKMENLEDELKKVVEERDALKERVRVLEERLRG